MLKKTKQNNKTKRQGRKSFYRLYTNAAAKEKSVYLQFYQDFFFTLSTSKSCIRFTSHRQEFSLLALVCGGVAIRQISLIHLVETNIFYGLFVRIIGHLLFLLKLWYRRRLQQKAHHSSFFFLHPFKIFYYVEQNAEVSASFTVFFQSFEIS